MTGFKEKRVATTRETVNYASRKQKWLLIVIAFAGVFVLVHLFSHGVSAQTKMQRYIVQPGDTVWAIAVHEAPSRDPRTLAQQIEQVNHLDSTDQIVPGETLLIPSLS